MYHELKEKNNGIQLLERNRSGTPPCYDEGSRDIRMKISVRNRISEYRILTWQVLPELRIFAR